jgi:uncharacterized OsmC-like protein
MVRRFDAMGDVNSSIGKALNELQMARDGIRIVVEGETAADEAHHKLEEAIDRVVEIRMLIEKQKYGFLLEQF